MAQAVAHPPVLWAQRQDCLYVTIDLQDCQAPKVDVQNNEAGKCGVLKFSGSVAGPEGAENYAFELELSGEVKPEETKISTTPRHVFVVIFKKEAGYWERLQRKAGKLTYLKVDWNKWMDEDDMEDSKDPFDLSAIENFTGMDGMGEEDEDSDDEGDEAPPLEGANGAGESSGEKEAEGGS